MIIAVIVGLIGREVLLYLGLQQVKNAVRKVQMIDEERQYSAECMAKGSVSDEFNMVHHSQVRFLDDRRYVVEVVCNRFERSPILVEEEELVPLVKKEVGHSGLALGLDEAINLTIFGRTGSVIATEENYTTSELTSATDIAVGAGPRSECQSFGYKCCDNKYQSGSTEKIDNVTDCTESCYSECLDRPLVLSFATEPHPVSLTRQLEVSSGQQISFNYLVSPDQKESFSVGKQTYENKLEELVYQVSSLIEGSQNNQETVQVTLDYGDGQQGISESLQGDFTHAYTCTSAPCEYMAKLSVINAQGVASYDDIQAQMKIIVK